MNLVTQSEWARTQGFSKQYASQLIQKGTIILVDGLIDPEQANVALASIRNPNQMERRKNSSTDTELAKILLKARIKSEMERGRLLEAKANAEVGKFVLAEDVKTAAFNKARIIRDSLMNIPDQVSPLLASISDSNKVHEILSREIRAVLEELSRDAEPL